MQGIEKSLWNSSFFSLMKVEDHQRKILRMEQTLTKLSNEADYEIIIEVCLLIAAHYLNAAMHHLRTLRIDRDIKHNRLYGELLRNKRLKEVSQAVAELINALEQLCPRHVYGAG